jgi:hypothetical protein
MNTKEHESGGQQEVYPRWGDVDSEPRHSSCHRTRADLYPQPPPLKGRGSQRRDAHARTQFPLPSQLFRFSHEKQGSLMKSKVKVPA